MLRDNPMASTLRGAVEGATCRAYRPMSSEEGCPMGLRTSHGRCHVLCHGVGNGTPYGRSVVSWAVLKILL